MCRATTHQDPTIPEPTKQPGLKPVPASSLGEKMTMGGWCELKLDTKVSQAAVYAALLRRRARHSAATAPQ
jgi:hypothetical protein